ncbi:YraN family protein [Thalassospira xiamenensis]|nr:YraN family protein [Thalassospira xiamenensis]
MSRHQAGVDAETQAIAYLERHGLRLVTRNYRAGKLEIDVIMQLDNRFIFVEVKFRQNENFASILEQITPSQCQRIRTAARLYLYHHKVTEHLTPMRFDVVAIVAEPAAIHWLQDAF